jgi:anti-sigma B factor antagonist
LLLKQEGAPMFSMDLSIRQSENRVVIALRGELDVTDAASAASALIALAGRSCEIIVDLAGLEFIDTSGLAALVLARKHARQAGGDLLLTAPQQPVLRMLTITRLIEVFAVQAGPEKVASSAEPCTAAAPVTARAAILGAAT